jgi:glycosyltransferase involved in cell wall biosynthesis
MNHRSPTLSDAPYSAKRKSVLMVTGGLARGGAERQMVGLSDGLLREGYKVRILELQGLAPGQATFKEEIAALSVPLHHASDFPPTSFDAVDWDKTLALDELAAIFPAGIADIAAKLTEAIITLRPSVVHCWSDVSNLVGGFVASHLAVPRIILGLRVMPPSFWYPADQAELYRTAYDRVAAMPAVVFISNSSTSATTFEDWVQLRRGTVQLVYNGFLPSGVHIRERGARSDCRISLRLPQNVPVVAAVMRFSDEKDPELWLDTAAAIAAVRADVHFVVAGYGHDDAAEKISTRATDLGLAARVVMPGATKDVGEVYAASDLLLLTSRTENVPNVMIEAQAAGIPVVGPDVGGISEAMLDGVTGLLVRERSAKALAAAVLQILGMPGWADRVALTGPEFVSRRFGQERMVSETIAIYEQDANGMSKPNPNTKQMVAEAFSAYNAAADALRDAGRLDSSC